MFDAFGEGQPLKLNLKVSTHSAGGDQQGLLLLGLASPAAMDDEIWKQLEEFRTGFGQTDR